MDSIVVREATPKDADEMARIREAGRWTGGASAARMMLYLAGEHHPQHAKAPRVVYVAEQRLALIGFVAGHLTTRFGCEGELQWFYVLPEYRGSSTATMLLERLAAWFEGQAARKVCVNVEPGNERARRFYRRSGAVELNEHWLVWSDISRVATL